MQVECVADYEGILSRSASGLRSCKEVLALVKERASIEDAYGSALIKQSRSTAGSLERGTARLGWYAFKTTTESLGRKHLELSSHFAADCTALTYLRDRLASSHKALATEGAGALKEAKASLTALQRTKARYNKTARELEAHVLQGVTAPAGSGPPTGVTSAREEPPTPATGVAVADVLKPAQAHQLLRDLQGGSSAYNESVRQHQEALRCLCGQLPKLLSDFERVEGQRIDSLKMALKKLLSAQESMLTAQRPLVYAATDMVDAIDRQDDVRQFKQELQCVSRGAEVEGILNEQARQLVHLEQQASLDGAGATRRSSMSAAARLVSGVNSHLREMDRATKVTNDFLGLSTGECFAGGLDLQEALSGAHLVAYSAHILPLNVEYLLPSENRLMRISETELLLEQETRVQLAPPDKETAVAAPTPASRELVEAQIAQAADFLRQLGAEELAFAVKLRVELLPDEYVATSAPSSPKSPKGASATPLGLLEFELGTGGEAAECSLSCTPQVFIALVNGTLEPSAAQMQQQLQTVTPGALIRVAQLWERERFVAFASEEALRQKRRAGGAEGEALPEESGQPEVAAEQPNQTERSALDIDEELVQIAKQQMRRLAEEGNESYGLTATSVGSLMWNALSAVGSEPTRAALWTSLRTLRGPRTSLLPRSGEPGAAVEGEHARGLELNELLEVLGGDTDLAQGFAFLPQAPPRSPPFPPSRAVLPPPPSRSAVATLSPPPPPSP